MNCLTFLNRCKGFKTLVDSFCFDSVVEPGPSEIRKVEICDISHLDSTNPSIALKHSESETRAYIPLNIALETGCISRNDVRSYLFRVMEKKFIPTPEDVDIIAGGPPCQGV